MEEWTTTRDTKMASALATLGILLRVETTLYEKRGERAVMFFLGLKSPCKRYLTKPLMSGLKSGKLEATKPSHELLTIFRGFTNRERLLDCANQGKFMRLVPVEGTEIWQYVPSDTGLAGVGKSEYVKTGDLKMAAALGVVGLPVVRIEGERNHRRFWLPRYGPVRAGLGRVDGETLLRNWREKPSLIPWEDPFSPAMRGLDVRERVLDAVNRQPDKVLLQKPGSKVHQSVLIQMRATDEAWDAAKRFLG